MESMDPHRAPRRLLPPPPSTLAPSANHSSARDACARGTLWPVCGDKRPQAWRLGGGLPTGPAHGWIGPPAVRSAAK